MPELLACRNIPAVRKDPQHHHPDVFHAGHARSSPGPCRKLFSADTNVKPEDAFDGKIIIVDLPVQEFRLAGRVANLVWKYCFQVAVLRRTQPTQKDALLAPGVPVGGRGAEFRDRL